jgi:hypothetical protein
MLADPFTFVLVAALSVPRVAVITPAVPPSAVCRLACATPPPPEALMRRPSIRPIRHVVAKKATAAVAGAILGFFVGMLPGAGIGAACNPDDENAALAGAMIGGTTGAIGGALLAIRWAR